MARSRWILGLVAVVAVILFDCDDWHTLDDVFTRTAVTGSRGWTGGDGAVGIRLPGGSDRTLWIFGDSPVTQLDANGTRVYFDGNAALANTVFGNTIAIQDDTASANPSQIHFIARNNDPGCSRVPGSGTPCLIADITRLTNDHGQGFLQFFDHRLLNLQPTADGPGYLWPSSGICLNCDNGSTSDDRLLLSFGEIKFCDPTKDTKCIPLCAFSGGSSDGPCTSGVKTLGTVITRVENPTATINQWQMTSVRVGGPVAWNTFLQDGSTLYIYGTRPALNPNADPTKAQQSDLIVASCPVADVLNQKWSYLKNGKFGPPGPMPSPSNLDRVTGVAGSYSITKIVRHLVPGYVLVHDNPFIDHFVYARTSTTPTSFEDVTTKTPRADIAAFDFSLRSEEQLRPLLGYCPVPTLEKDSRGCALNYHAIAHPHLSFTDPDGISALVFSYIIPQALFPTSSSGIDTYRPKFGALPIDNLTPWCTHEGQPCWEGLAFQYSNASIGNTNQSPMLTYDVSKASRINVSLLNGSGNPEVYVRFGFTPDVVTFDCRTWSNTFPKSCDIAVPPGQARAYVMVRGDVGATYFMRVVYAGD